MPDCTDCAKAATRRWYAGYSLTCLSCCARLVMHQRPNKRAAAVMLEAIGRQKGAPGRAEVLAEVKRLIDSNGGASERIAEHG